MPTVYLNQYNVGIGTAPPINYYITVKDSYIGSTLFANALNFSSKNPDFLNLTGYLGIYGGQQYDINSSNIKNEANLPIYVNGSQIALIPQTAKDYRYNITDISTASIRIGVNSSKAPDVVLQYNNLYKKTLYIAYIYTNGVIYKDWAFNSNSSSTYNVTYDPATMPLDPTIVVIPWTPTSPNPPPLTPIIVNAGNSVLQFIEQPYVLIPLIILIVAAVVLVSTGRRKY